MSILATLPHQDSLQFCKVSPSFQSELDLFSNLLGYPKILKLSAFNNVDKIFFGELIDQIFLAELSFDLFLLKEFLVKIVLS